MAPLRQLQPLTEQGKYLKSRFGKYAGLDRAQSSGIAIQLI